jgi:hypothetical protein
MFEQTLVEVVSSGHRQCLPLAIATLQDEIRLVVHFPYEDDQPSGRGDPPDWTDIVLSHPTVFGTGKATV